MDDSFLFYQHGHVSFILQSIFMFHLCSLFGFNSGCFASITVNDCEIKKNMNNRPFTGYF